MPKINTNILLPGQIDLSSFDVPDAEENIKSRLLNQLPVWFNTDHEVLDTVLESYVLTSIFNFSQLVYDRFQMRLQGAFGDNLDLISCDYFGTTLPRRVDESDNAFKRRIKANLLQERATRHGMDNALYILTGYHPKLFEPWRPIDCGAYNVADSPYTVAYGTHGAYGSGSYAYQAFIDVYVSAYQGMASRSGYNDYYFGYNAVGAPAIGWYGSDALEQTVITDQDIYQTINMTKVEGTVCWVRINRI